jgi:hypothetical protein
VESITWEALQEPAKLSAIVILMMTILLKPAIDLLFGLRNMENASEKEAEQWDKFRGLVINMVTVLLCGALSYWRLALLNGDWLVLTVISSALAALGYEAAKNAIGSLTGLDIKNLNVFRL